MVSLNKNNTFLEDAELLINSKIEEMKKDLEDIQRLRQKYGTDNNTPISNTITTNKGNNSVVTKGRRPRGSSKKMPSIPSTYDKNNNTWEQRYLFILRELGSGFVDDVIRTVLKYEPDTSVKTIKNSAVNKLSKMYRMGWINAKQYGKKNKYSLKEA